MLLFSRFVKWGGKIRNRIIKSQPLSKGPITTPYLPPSVSEAGKCTSHLGTGSGGYLHRKAGS